MPNLKPPRWWCPDCNCFVRIIMPGAFRLCYECGELVVRVEAEGE